MRWLKNCSKQNPVRKALDLNDKKIESLPAWAYVIGIFIFVLFAVVGLSVLFQSTLPERNFRANPVMAPDSMMRVDFNSALEFRETLELVNLLLTTLNILLLLYLLYNYAQIYRQIGSTFSMGLLIMVSALLAHAIGASPIVTRLFGFRGMGLGPFTIIPSVFTLIAALVLIYLSRQ
jgi:hypothetical protein